ncbi:MULTISPECIES: DUF6443 domain-containing protein [Chryseobacterium]|uniref:RHS repeat-associated protein n=1 Tax=Chryseobacterium geocarposphaerae TaxID=1416776 RepID=A0ABU1LGM7_9FLAO|nr:MULTISPECIES: DUF6443 domain-containing protein [Chryseobacterium]MDR6405878.1 RHS repeat-associated protein [Chryseobacterium geocarposphaerae]MDR6698958.1 RHS repeat-associated protein [Chryseobacterium ginsenosidimutans]
MKKYKLLNRNLIGERLKIKKYFSLLALGLASFIAAQTTPTTTENYIYTKVYLSQDGNKKSEIVQYFDGLGRAKQVIQVKITPTGQDLAVPIVYDDLGRQTKTILPVPMPTTNLGIQSVSEASANAYYGVVNAYSEQKLEASPLARVLEAANPGAEWMMNSGHTVKSQYLSNTSTDQVKNFNTSSTWSNGILTTSITSISSYGANQLSKGIITDEDGNKTQEFKNSEGKTILLRKESSTGKQDTYYIYNDYSQLAFVVSPKGVESIDANGNTVTQQILNDLCYQYIYDNRYRTVEKKLPGKGWEYFVYDQQNRVVASQDAGMKSNSETPNQWIFKRYDKFGRTLYTGRFIGGTRMQEQNNANAKGMNNESRSTTSFTLNGQEIFYTNSAYPSQTFIPYTVNYYDSYPGNILPPSAILNQNTIASTVNITVNNINSIRSLKTMPTTSLVKNLDDDNWSSTHIWYDHQGRPIGSYGKNHLDGYTKAESKLDFAGVALQTKTYHKRLNTDTEKVITETFTYDSQNRLKIHKHKIDNNPEEILAQNEYNELSQLITKKVGGINEAAPLQTVNYQYNIRGWLTYINDPNNLGSDLFGYKIKYSQVEGLEVPDTSDPSLKVLPKYNGNIAEVDWKSAAQQNEPLKRYGYVYDDTSRLLAGFYQNSINPSLREYYEKMTYDLNGNVKTLKRTAGRMGATALLIDNLSYQYENSGASNRLQKVTEAVTIGMGYPYKAAPVNIGYDDNGNITSYPDKDISNIQYNILNLPKQITQNGQVMNYSYRADGVKVKKLFAGVETHYLDGFQYKYTEPWEDPNGTIVNAEMRLRIIPTSEGYYDALREKYFYNYTDHLGNVRMSYSDADGNGVVTGDIAVTNCQDTPDGQVCENYIITGEVEGVSNYYPFGLLHNSQLNDFNNVYQYKYNGKELQETGMYDYGARFYMPDVGRWGVVDPLAEKYTSWSPYNYTVNNPVLFVDPDGRGVEYNWGTGEYEHFDKNGSRSSLDEWDAMNYLLGQGYSVTAYRTNALGVSGQTNKGTGDNYFSGIDFTQFGADDNEEEPVSFFGKDDGKAFHQVFKQMHDLFKNTKGDGIFRVYAHGNFGTLFNGEDQIRDAKTFDTVMKSKNKNWANVDKMKDPILILFACLSGQSTVTTDAIGKQISRAHPNLTVIAFKGFVTYDPSVSGIKNINAGQDKGDGRGGIVFYQNGQYLTGYLYNQFLKKYPNFK